MTDAQDRAFVEEQIRANLGGDLRAAAGLLADDYLEEYPQSGEVIRGRANALAQAAANHGVRVQPHYVTEIRDSAGGVLRTVGGGAGDQIISAATAAKLTTYLVQAVEAPGAFAFGAKISGVHVAGKTGTAENPAGSPHGWFVGFAPAEDPQVAVAVIIENAGQGGVDAAPLGGAVMKAALGK